MAKLEKTLLQVRDLIGSGEIKGDPAFYCRAVASLDHAQPQDLAFVRDDRYLDKARRCLAGALIVGQQIEESKAHQLVVDNPMAAFITLLQHVSAQQRRHHPGIHPTAWVGKDVELGESVSVGPGAVIEESAQIGERTVIGANAYVGQRSIIGADSTLHPNVVIREDIVIGERVVIHSGTVVGADGYGYFQHEGRHIKIPQVGSIEIGDDVEIGALVTIDRAALDVTVIGKGTKIGDLVHVGHNCEVGEHVLLLPTVAVSGSVRIGDHALLAGRAGTADGVTIGQGAVLAGCCVAYKDVAAGAVMWGNPARQKNREMRIQSALNDLPEMRRTMRALQQQLDGKPVSSD